MQIDTSLATETRAAHIAPVAETLLRLSALPVPLHTFGQFRVSAEGAGKGAFLGAVAEASTGCASAENSVRPRATTAVHPGSVAISTRLCAAYA
eukprot:3940644-Rhodomonas_salina.2